MQLDNCTSRQTSLTNERETLKKSKTAIEATSRSLTTERDNLQRELRSCNLQKNSLTQERDGLKRSNTAIEAQSRTLSLEKNQLTRTLSTCTSEKNALTKEKDEQAMKFNDFAQFAVQQKWLYYSGSFYFISTTKKNWISSRYDCKRNGADLVIINSREEELFTRNFKKKAWIGLHDRIREGNWQWVDGTALSESYWKSGAPNHYMGRNEDCAEIQKFDSEESWNDAACENENYWICEKIFNFNG
ncbi:hepatic lectin-like [Cyprinodon tularosa]|uniref:hepatic lectin-like n=1 Tax=Cyprinodon tularosa TaxID=77115 RepID=UPI0018E22E8F|nr:hepatic lectin-like [Cyprinodon tularosa]